jgi:outer membrane protein assembly factor BamB
MWKLKRTAGVVAGLALVVSSLAHAEDWTRFRGPNGSGVAASSESVPSEWGDDKNLAWKLALPGPGSSSPIVIGSKVFLTCYSGYGVEGNDPGSLSDLKRHLVCIDATNGTLLWDKSVAATMPEDSYSRMLGEHGYASGSPVSDGEHVYVFYGKGGVLAYNLDGTELWHVSVGKESGPMRWGSGASPILHDNLVIVNASEENQAVVALDKATGKEVWKAEADGLGNTWGTPVIAGEGDAAELVIGVPGEIWGLNIKTGKLKWYAEGLTDNSFCSSLITDGQIVYAIEGRGGEGVAVRIGGKDDVTKTHTVWRATASGRITSPILHDGRLYSSAGGMVLCLSAATGEKVYQARFPSAGGAAAPAEPPPGGREFGGGGFGGRGGRGSGGTDYASPILVGDKFILVTRSGLTHVWQTGPEFKSLAQNKFASDSSKFNGTPAVSGGRLFIRSDKALYCVKAK